MNGSQCAAESGKTDAKYLYLFDESRRITDYTLPEGKFGVHKGELWVC